MLRASPNQVVAGTEGRAGGLAGQRRRVGPRATAPSEAMRSSQSDRAQVCALPGPEGCSHSAARRPSERAPPSDHLDSILFARKPRVGGGRPQGGVPPGGG